MDPTLNLPPIVMTKKWGCTPSRGAGWWGRAPPLQVHHNYRARDLVDGGGLCSPGRWDPQMRMLPELDDVGRLLVEAMQVDMEVFEKASMEMFAGTCKDPRSQKNRRSGERSSLRIGAKIGATKLGSEKAMYNRKWT